MMHDPITHLMMMVSFWMVALCYEHWVASGRPTNED